MNARRPAGAADRPHRILVPGQREALLMGGSWGSELIRKPALAAILAFVGTRMLLIDVSKVPAPAIPG